MYGCVCVAAWSFLGIGSAIFTPGGKNGLGHIVLLHTS